MRRLVALLVGLATLSMLAGPAAAQPDSYGFTRGGGYPRLIYQRFNEIAIASSGGTFTVLSADLPAMTLGRHLQMQAYIGTGFNTTACTLTGYLGPNTAANRIFIVDINSNTVEQLVTLDLVGFGNGVNTIASNTQVIGRIGAYLQYIMTGVRTLTATVVNTTTTADLNPMSTRLLITLGSSDAATPACIWHGATISVLSDGVGAP